MANWLHVPTKSLILRHSPAMMAARFGVSFTDANGKPQPPVGFLHQPDLSAVEISSGVYHPTWHWEINASVVTLADLATRDTVDATRLATRRDAVSDTMDGPESYERALALLVLDGFNQQAATISSILDAVDNASNFGQLKTAIVAIANPPQRTSAQLKTALRARMDT